MHHDMSEQHGAAERGETQKPPQGLIPLTRNVQTANRQWSGVGVREEWGETACFCGAWRSLQAAAAHHSPPLPKSLGEALY